MGIHFQQREKIDRFENVFVRISFPLCVTLPLLATASEI